MTVSQVSPRAVYIGNSSSTQFGYAFEITDSSVLVVTKITIAGLIKQALVEGVGFTVDTEVNEVTIVGPPLSSAFAIEIRRSETYEQATSYSTQGNFSPATLEQALDYVTMLIQQVLDFTRSLTGVNTLSTVTVGTLPSALQAAPALIYVRDAAGGGIPCFSDGTNWRRVDTRGIVS